MTPLVSIIIPTYNRAHLIGETLDSVLAQTYTNWQCIVVDDGSTDNALNVYNTYKAKDMRFVFMDRHESKPKGANACRNTGLEYATGDYVVFFDSDDLMTPNHLEVKVSAMQIHNCDYVITRTKFFNADLDYINNYYQFDKFDITPYNYVSQNINWLTYDICVTLKLAQSIRFNEQLQSGQEYNYFSKLVHQSTDGQFIDEVVTLRRYHENSIRSNLKKQNALDEGAFRANWFTYLDLLFVAKPKTLEVLIRRCVALVYKTKQVLIKEKVLFVREIFRFYNYKGIYFLLMLFGVKLFNKGYFFRNKLIKSV